MSPYRVLVKYPDGSEGVIAAMLSKDKVFNVPYIYIISKHDSFIHTHEELAHRQTSKSNSEILYKYHIDIAPNIDLRKRYKVYDPRINVKYTQSQYTISDCLKFAMEIYCNQESLYIEEIL